jgi:hypothetical protein
VNISLDQYVQELERAVGRLTVERNMFAAEARRLQAAQKLPDLRVVEPAPPGEVDAGEDAG